MCGTGSSKFFVVLRCGLPKCLASSARTNSAMISGEISIGMKEKKYKKSERRWEGELVTSCFTVTHAARLPP